MVAHLDEHPLVARFGRDIDHGNAGLRRFAVAACVLQQVGDDSQQLDFIGQHSYAVFDGNVDLHVVVFGDGVERGFNHGAERHAFQLRRLGSGVVEKFVDDRVELLDVCNHVITGVRVGHTQFGFQPQARQRCAQIVRNTGQHDDAVLLNLGELLGHAVKADVDFTNLAGGDFLVEQAGVKVAVAHAAGRKRQLLERAVDEPRDQRRAEQRHRRSRHQPDGPGAAARRPDFGSISQQPVPVAVNRKADPQSFLTVNTARHHGAGSEARLELGGDALAEFVAVKNLENVCRFTRADAHPLFVGQRLDQRDPGDGVGVTQRGATEVDQRRELLGILNRARLGLKCPKCLQPGKDRAEHQQRQKEKGPPKQVEPAPGPHVEQGGRCLERGGHCLGRKGGVGDLHSGLADA